MWSCLRWPLLVLGLGVLYHVAVGQPKHARFGLVTPSALAATLLWLIASGLFGGVHGQLRELQQDLRLACVIAVLIGAEIDGLSAASPTRAT